jgi:hypothetical protein
MSHTIIAALGAASRGGCRAIIGIAFAIASFCCEWHGGERLSGCDLWVWSVCPALLRLRNVDFGSVAFRRAPRTGHTLQPLQFEHGHNGWLVRILHHTRANVFAMLILLTLSPECVVESSQPTTCVCTTQLTSGFRCKHGALGFAVCGARTMRCCAHTYSSWTRHSSFRRRHYLLLLP